jgi:hypothetical protein
VYFIVDLSALTRNASDMRMGRVAHVFCMMSSPIPAFLENWKQKGGPRWVSDGGGANKSDSKFAMCVTEAGRRAVTQEVAHTSDRSLDA